MKKISTVLVLVGALLTVAMPSYAQEVTREEFNALLQRLESIESKLNVQRKSEIEAVAEQALATIPQSQAERESFIEDVVIIRGCLRTSGVAFKRVCRRVR